MAGRSDAGEKRPRPESETFHTLKEGCENSQGKRARHESRTSPYGTPSPQEVPSLGSAMNVTDKEMDITSIQATDVALGLRRLPTGFYAMVHHSGLEWKTENKRSPVNNDAVEWNGPIPIPSDLSATICIEVYAAFEFQSMLGIGEQLRTLTITVEQLLDCSTKAVPFTFSNDGDVVSPCSSILITVKLHKWYRNDPAAKIRCSTTETRSDLEDATNRGHSALLCFQKQGGTRNLECSIEEFEHALNICPLDHPCRAAAQSNLAMAKFILCQVEDTDVSLDIPLGLYHSALISRPVGHLDRPSTLIQLAMVHFAIFKEREDAIQAEALLHEAIKLSSTDSHESQVATFLLQVLTGRSADPVEEDRQSSAEQDTASCLSDEDPAQLLERFEQLGDLADLQRAVMVLEELVRSMSVRDDWYCACMGTLGLALWHRFKRLGGLSDLEDAISRHRAVLNITPNGHPRKPTCLGSLGNCFRARFERLGELSDLEDAISMLRDVIELNPRDHPHMPDNLNNLGNSLLTRFEYLGEPSDLEDAISTFRNAVDLTSRSHPHKLGYLGNLGNSLKARFHRFGELRDLEDAILMFEDAVNLIPHVHPHKPGVLNNLGNSFKARFRHLGQLNDLDNAISMLRNAVNLIPGGHPDKPTLLDNLGDCLRAHFERLGRLDSLEDAISMYKSAVDLTPHGHTDEAGHLSNLGSSLFTRYERLGELSDLEDAVSMFRNAVDLTPHSHPDRPGRIGNLSNSLFTRFGQLGELNDLEGAISRHRDAFDLIPDDHPHKYSCLTNLGSCLFTRFKRLGDVGDLEDAIRTLRNAFDFTPHDHPNKPACLSNLGSCFFARFERHRELSDLEEAILTLRDAVDLTPDGHLNKPSYLNNLGNSFLTRFEHLGQLDDLASAISILGQAVDATPHGHPFQASCLNNLGNSFKARFEHLGELSDLKDAISRYRSAVDLTAGGHPEKSGRLNNLGNSLRAHFERLGEPSSLEEAISMLKNAVNLTSCGHPERPKYLSNLGNSFFTRFEYLGELCDLESTISMLRDAVDLTPPDHPDQPGRRNSLGNSLGARFEYLGELSDLEDAILMYRGAVDHISQGHPDQPGRLNNLGDALFTRFMRLGDLSDLEDSIRALRDAVNLTPHDHPDMPSLLSNLGNSLFARFKRLGELSGLEEAISSHKNAVDLIPDGHPYKPGFLNNLGGSLFARFERLGELSDLESAILMFRGAVDLGPHHHAHRPKFLNSLGISVKARFECLGELDDLEEAISRLRDALDLVPRGHFHKPNYLNNLGASFLARFRHLGELNDLEDAILMLKDAVDLVPYGHSGRPSLLNSLGSFLRTRFDHLGELSDLEGAISTLRDAVRLTPRGHADLPNYLTNLGNSFMARFEHFGEQSNLEDAISLYLHAASNPIGPIHDRFRASQKWISCARRMCHHTLLHAYSISITLLPRLAWVGLSLAHRYSELTRAADVVREAAAAALDLGFPEIAVEWLEQGRSIVWGELFQLRKSYEELSSAHPDHARRLRELSTALEHASAAREKSSSILSEQTRMAADPATPSLQQEADRHRTLAIQRDKLLEEIRSFPGFERFLLYKDFSQLCASTHSGPVIILNAADSRCDALVVLPDVSDVIHIPLPNFTFQRSAGLQAMLERLLGHARVICCGDREGKAATLGCVSWESLLSTLWTGVVKPVLDALAFSAPGDLSRIFWCPTGPFVFLPIHAAGFYNTQPSQSGLKVSDFVISSYVPTLSILASPPNPAAVPNGDTCFLAVRQPPSDGLPPLLGVNTELEHIRAVIRNAPLACTTLLESSTGTVEEVLELLKDADWVHFACHGVQDALDSGLCLADRRRLKLRDIITLSRPHGGLAFLSACQTAMGDENLSDEAIHIAAGMLFAGYGGVVGTMWSISDSLAPRVTRDVYGQLFRNGTKPDYREAARALHEAIGRLRDSGSATFVEWLPFIHVGL